jgi:integrase
MTANKCFAKPAETLDKSRVLLVQAEVTQALETSTSVCQRFIAYRLLLLVTIGATLGVRLADALNLCYGCISLEYKDDDPAKPQLKVDFYEGKNMTLSHWNVHYVPVTDDESKLGRMLLNYIKRFCKKSDEQFLFTTSLKDVKKAKRDTIAMNLKKYETKGERLTFHCFRRSLAHNLHENDFTDEQIQDFFNWRDPRMVTKYTGQHKGGRNENLKRKRKLSFDKIEVA